LNGTIEVVLLDDFIPDPADVFDVIIADGFEFGDLFSIIFPQLPGGHYFTWSLFTLENGEVTFRIVDPEINVVAEPVTLTLFGFGLVGLGIARRRRAA
jgi:hypothetical protein